MAPEYDNEEQINGFTREQAIQIARAEAKRGYSEQDDSISFVAHLSEFHAFCLCRFEGHEGAWIKTCRLLGPGDWLPGE